MGISSSSESDSSSVDKMQSKLSSQELRPKRHSESSVSTLGSGTSTGVSSHASFSSTESIGGTKIGLHSFTSLKVLGKGSHGKVLLVRKRDSQQCYAMKELKKSQVYQRQQVTQTLNELETHVRLWRQEDKCPYIVPLRWAFHTRSRLYMVFDFCAGGELYFHLGQRGKVPEALARFYAAEIALALEHLHKLGIVYHDLKPENLVLNSAGHINLVDFGLCKTPKLSKTNSRDMCGTTEYLAPEMLLPSSNLAPSHALDWWAFGMVLYEMLTGLPPWYSYDQHEVVCGILRGELTFPDYVSSVARSLISKLLVREPSERLGARRTEDILGHDFFDKVDWESFRNCTQTVPFVPPCEENDASNFDESFTKLPLQAEAKPSPPQEDAFGCFCFSHEIVLKPAGFSTTADDLNSDEIIRF